MTARHLLLLMAVLELGAGIGMLALPGLSTQLLVGQALEGAQTAPARLTGAALFALGLASWLERDASPPPRGLVAALLAYNAAVPLVLAPTAVLYGAHTLMAWSACVLHAMFAVWCALVLLGLPRGAAR